MNSGVLIVTGASRGIGAAIARLAARHGFDVVVNFSRNESAANEVVRTIAEAGGRAVSICADVAREHEVIQLFETAERKLGRLAALVNNAGITGGFARVEALGAEALGQVLAVNVAGTILCSREAVRRMSIGRGGKGGVIVNISSLAARTGGAGEWVHYAATKGAVNT